MAINAHPLRLVWTKTALPHPQVPLQFALTVPKRRFPKASQRNRIRRQMREVYRLYKPNVYEVLGGQKEQFAWMLIYIGKEAVDYAAIEKALQKITKRFSQQLS